MFGFLEWEFYTNSTTINVLLVYTRVFTCWCKVGEDAESSLNTEIGFRFRKKNTKEKSSVIDDFSTQGSDSMSGGVLEQGIYSMQGNHC
jgi:membrane glycosyltransferase